MPRPQKDLTGLTCNTLTVTGPSPNKPRHWIASCSSPSCGSKSYRADKLRDGTARCQVCDSKRQTHGRTVGGRRDYLRVLYDNIRARTRTDWYAHIVNPLYPSWAASFDVFARDVIAELGERPTAAHSLDRIDGKLGYQPHNIQWAVIEQQNQNRRQVKRYSLTPGAPKFTLFQWAVHFQRLTGDAKWTEAKLKELMETFSLEQINSAIHPNRPTPQQLAEARKRTLAEAEHRAAQEHFTGLAPDGFTPDHSTDEDADGYGEIFE